MWKLFSLTLLLCLVLSAPNSYGGTTGPCPAISPCTAYCGYSISGYTLSQNCGGFETNNGGCTSCDGSIFELISGYCIPHLRNSEAKHQYFYLGGSTYQLGFRSGGRNTITSNNNLATVLSSGIPAHYAVRIKFGIYMLSNFELFYTYPLEYSLDTTKYGYNNADSDYFTCYDVVTSPLQAHFNSTLTVNWLNANSGLPNNIAGCSNCNCGDSCTACCGGCGGCGFCNCRVSNTCGCGAAGGIGCNCSASLTFNCCENRYIEIRDLLVLVSKCPTGCSSCLSATVCSSCSGGYILNLADELCYTSCPQATYANGTMYYHGDAATGAYPGYTQVFMTYCVPCNQYCMECLNSTYCTRCYQSGRNESYLLNHTCYL
jgi:hypothetical protein